jgi:membrane-associated protease RseP (regulator of RpoE activity)
MAKRIMTGGRILPIKELTKLKHDRFTGSSPLANYAQARAFFLYIYSTGKLKEWYATYTTSPESGYAADPTGLKSLEAAFGKPSTEIDKDYKIWLKALPTVAEQIRPGAATISVDVEQGDGDGPVIAAIPSDVRGKPNPARQAGLRIKDVITAIDGKPTRDLNELVRLLGEHQAGDVVEVAYRRGKIHGTAKVTLVPR